MTKKQFTNFIKELIALQKDADLLNKALKRFDPDFNYLTFSRYENLSVSILREAMKDEADWIGFWYWELDKGKRAKSGTVKGKNGKNIPIKTISDLYNLIKPKP